MHVPAVHTELLLWWPHLSRLSVAMEFLLALSFHHTIYQNVKCEGGLIEEYPGLVPRLHSPAFIAQCIKAGEWSLGARLGIPIKCEM